MNENTENMQTVSENAVEIPVDAYVETFLVTVENVSDNEEIAALLEDIKEILNGQNVRLEAVSEDVEEIRRETVSQNDIETVSENNIFEKSFDEYTSRDVFGVCVCLSLFVIIIILNLGGR